MGIVVGYGAAPLSDLLTAAGSDVRLHFLLPAGEHDPDLGKLLQQVGPTAIIGCPTGEDRDILRKLDGLTTFSEAQVELTAALSQEHGLRFHDLRTAVRLRNKLLQRRSLAARGLPMPASASVRAGWESSGWGHFPCVVKPVRGEASRGVRVIAARRELNSFVSSLGTGDRFLVEEYLDDAATGPDWLADLVSIESVVSGGHITHWGVTDRLPFSPTQRETGSVAPSPRDDGTVRELTSAAETALRALGVANGVCHTELKLTSGGPVVIEVNGRLGGFVTDLYRTVGVGDLVRAALDVACGIPAAEPQASQRIAAVLVTDPDEPWPELNWPALTEDPACVMHVTAPSAGRRAPRTGPSRGQLAIVSLSAATATQLRASLKEGGAIAW